MNVEKISEDKLDYVGAICLDPSIGRQEREKMQPAMRNRIAWIKKMMVKRLAIFVALEKPKPQIIHYKWAGKMKHSDLALHRKVPMGLLESIPIKFALEPVEGEGLFINCMWVLPPFWLTGVGKSLLENFIISAKEFGGASVISYEGDRWFGTSINYMPSSFFKKYEFKEVDRDGSRVLLYRNLGVDIQPKFISSKPESLNKNGNMIVEIFFNSQCPWSKYMVDKIKVKAKIYPEIAFKFINTDERRTIEKFGISRGVRINGKPIIKRIATWEEVELEIKKAQKE